jgi:glycosyltransferase involved in cell wall biosynthesis
LAAALIVKNEEATLEACLHSLIGIDEIVILDTGSTDKTVDLARRLNLLWDLKLTVHEGYEWHDDFADARNTCNRKCTSDWILTIDADETLDEGGLEKIRRVIDEVEGMGESMETIQALVHCDNDQFYHDRIFRNKPDLYYLSPIHEYLHTMAKFHPEGEDEISITFQKRGPRGEDAWWRMRIIEGCLRKEPDDLRMQYVAGREYFVMGFLPNAIYWLERYLRNREQRAFWMGANEIADVHFTLAWAYAAMMEFKPAKEHALLALGYNADFKEACKLLSMISNGEGKPLNKDRWEEFAEKAENRELGFKSKGII